MWEPELNWAAEARAFQSHLGPSLGQWALPLDLRKRYQLGGETFVFGPLPHDTSEVFFHRLRLLCPQSPFLSQPHPSISQTTHGCLRLASFLWVSLPPFFPSREHSPGILAPPQDRALQLLDATRSTFSVGSGCPGPGNACQTGAECVA